jgi:DNA invertase Pin-like site-specific DNA recombinase
MRPGDTLMVTRVDRLARSVGDLQDIVKTLRNRGVSLKVTDQPIDSSTAAGKAFLDMLGVFAEFAWRFPTGALSPLSLSEGLSRVSTHETDLAD